MLHRILFPVLFFAISILLLNSIGKEVSTQNIEKMRFVIFDNNMNVTYYTSNVSFGNAFIGDSCDAFNEYDGKYIKYNPRFVYDSPCYENSGNYNMHVRIMFVIIINELIMLFIVCHLFYYYQQCYEIETLGIRRNKTILVLILSLFTISVCCDIYSFNSEIGISIFYGNKIYDIAGVSYLVRDRFNLRGADYLTKINAATLSKSICDAMYSIHMSDNSRLEQIIEMSRCNHVRYGIAPAAIVRCFVIALSFLTFAIEYCAKRRIDD
uniref:Uncharacterized protein n=1 Tax=viral metagenome TaxID=1070528 RepID=A0A6C0C9I7_9ZZZZ